MALESDILRQIMLKASALGYRIFRNNTGTAWQGKYIKLANGDVLLKNPRIVHFGLCNGGGDLVGWKTVTITPDMVGKNVAIFTSIEAKTATGRVRPEQKNFIDQVYIAGGIAFVARSADEVEERTKEMSHVAANC